MLTRSQAVAVLSVLGFATLMTSVYAQRLPRRNSKRQVPSEARQYRTHRQAPPSPSSPRQAPSHQFSPPPYVIDNPFEGLNIQRSSIPRGSSPRHLTAGFTPPSQTNPAGWVTVDPSLSLDAQTRALYQRMATDVSGYAAVPNDRANYYSSVINDVGYWGGMLVNVRASPQGGYVASVLVRPTIADGQLYGSSTVIISDYSETYYVDANDNVTYGGFSDPNGWAGMDCVGGIY